ncbi:MAG: hypothetical protein WAX38_00145 [Minisyncoccia bacterium]
MKKIILIIVLIILAGVGGRVFWTYKQKNTTEQQAPVTSQTKTIPSGTVLGTYSVNDGEDAVFDPSTGSVWVANIFSNSIQKFNASSGVLLGTYTVDSPLKIAFDSFSKSIWVASNGSILSKINPTNGSVIGKYALDDKKVGFISELVFNSLDHSLWVTSIMSGGYEEDSIVRIDVSTGAVHATYPFGYNATDAAFDVSSNSIWVSHPGFINTKGKEKNGLSKLDTNTGIVSDTYFTGSENSYPSSVTFDSLTNSIWVANGDMDVYEGSFPSNTVSKINAESGAIVGTYTVAGNPVNIEFDLATGSIWVVSDKEVVQINAKNGDLIGKYALGINLRKIIFDQQTGTAWVIDRTAKKLIKIKS